MKFTPTEIPDVILIEPDVFPDDRGYFFESYHSEKYAEGGIGEPFVQDNQSHSIRGTLRGLHAQRLQPQGKLVRTLSGEIFDVAVDIRPSSPTFGRWVGAILSGRNRHQLWVPPGFAHGFAVLSDRADVLYKCTTLYRKDDEICILWSDPEIGIDWKLPSGPLLSSRDAEAPRLSKIRDQLVG
jgi:dTDP-4-dehydrorhamnose 3,5-epimerase